MIHGNESEQPQLAFHEAAEIFPLLEGREYEELRNDIAENSQLDPIRSL